MGKTTVRHKGALEVQETEIDLLAVSKNADNYLLGECKFKNKPFRYSEFLDTAAKLSQQKDKADFYYFLFSESGFDESILQEAESNDRLCLFDLEDIVSKRF